LKQDLYHHFKNIKIKKTKITAKNYLIINIKDSDSYEQIPMSKNLFKDNKKFKLETKIKSSKKYWRSEDAAQTYHSSILLMIKYYLL
jgi:hypothetical protein